MGAPHVQRVGAPDDQDGLPHRIHGPVPSDPVCDVDQDPGKGEPLSRYGDEPPENARKTSYKDRRPSAGRARLLLFPLFSAEQIRRLEAHFKPKGNKHCGENPVVQNGYPSVRPSFTRRGYPPIPDSKYAGLGTGHVGRLSRLRGRLLPCRDRSSRQKISEVRVRRYHLRVPSLTVRPLYGPKNVHTSSTGRRRLPQDVRVNLFQYLDDWLVVGGSYDLTLQYRYLVRTCVQEIRFLINEENSDWVPTQFPSFLGSSLDLVRALARPSGDRIDRLRRLIGRVMKEGSSTARLWRSLCGHLASMIYLVPKARQHIRLLQFFVQNQWSQDMPDTTRIRLTQSARAQLEWWLDPTNLTLGVPFSTPDLALIIVTDASSYGWGGHLGDQTASGVWPDQWKSKHINWLELQAIWLTLKHFQDQVRDQVVEVLSDNSTRVSYINRQGGTHSLTLCRLALDMWEWCDQLAIVPIAVHLQGTRNVLADALSRGRYTLRRSEPCSQSGGLPW